MVILKLFSKSSTCRSMALMLLLGTKWQVLSLCKSVRVVSVSEYLSSVIVRSEISQKGISIHDIGRLSFVSKDTIMTFLMNWFAPFLE